MCKFDNSSKATGGNTAVNVTGSGSEKDELTRSVLSFAMDIPRVVRANSTAWGITILFAVALCSGAVYLNMSHAINEIRESQERIEKSLVNMHNKYNRITRYIKTGDVSSFSKDKQDNIEED